MLRVQELAQTRMGHSDERTIYEVRMKLLKAFFYCLGSMNVKMISFFSRCSKGDSLLRLIFVQ